MINCTMVEFVDVAALGQLECACVCVCVWGGGGGGGGGG